MQRIAIDAQKLRRRLLVSLTLFHRPRQKRPFRRRHNHFVQGQSAGTFQIPHVTFHPLHHHLCKRVRPPTSFGSRPPLFFRGIGGFRLIFVHYFRRHNHSFVTNGKNTHGSRRLKPPPSQNAPTV